MDKLLFVLRSLGVFWLCRRLTTNRLRILCYHGISFRDEHTFNGGLFMRPETFKRRMELLKSLGLTIIGLDDAVRLFSAGRLPPSATVITIDDGWYGTFRHMHPVLREMDLPATLYVASAFVESQSQVYNVAIQYVLWRNQDKIIEAESIREGALSRDFELGDPEQRRQAESELTRFGFGYEDLSDRQSLWREVCDALGENWQEIERERRLAFISKDELQQMMADGLDIQLHTHGHRFPAEDREEASREVSANREYLNSVSAGEYVHFCYPSGQYEVEQIDDLRDLGVVSATTTKGGFNRQGTSVYELHRLIDTDHKSDIEFEARVSGLMDLVDGSKLALRQLLGGSKGAR